MARSPSGPKLPRSRAPRRTSMSDPRLLAARPRWQRGTWALLGVLACGCSATIGDNHPAGGMTIGPDGKPINGGGVVGGTGMTPGGNACTVPAAVPQRIVRLDY